MPAMSRRFGRCRNKMIWWPWQKNGTPDVVAIRCGRWLWAVRMGVGTPMMGGKVDDVTVLLLKAVAAEGASPSAESDANAAALRSKL